jgi:hypothetical protein
MSEQPEGPDREIHDADEVGVEEQVTGRDATTADEIGTEEGT